ncbi:hypothetical protein L1987_00128 [Smallanthus sonchifolius]|uniref:Uncharacterized protein n=1 Tax=Smallanthus sonchifolius TaxID=185202 RepID=A0ACB9K1E3_9ASTR|nr:hypothetical protein L1987_00128 [Smallanthus sonchifolius]
MKPTPFILSFLPFRSSPTSSFQSVLQKMIAPVGVSKARFLLSICTVPSNGKLEVEGIFGPPYYEWFKFNKEFTDYEKWKELVEKARSKKVNRRRRSKLIAKG